MFHQCIEEEKKKIGKTSQKNAFCILNRFGKMITTIIKMVAYLFPVKVEKLRSFAIVYRRHVIGIFLWKGGWLILVWHLRYTLAWSISCHSKHSLKMVESLKFLLTHHTWALNGNRTCTIPRIAVCNVTLKKELVDIYPYQNVKILYYFYFGIHSITKKRHFFHVAPAHQMQNGLRK